MPAIVSPSRGQEAAPPRRGLVAVGACSLAVSLVAMGALHVLQPTLDPWRAPVSFYYHGAHGRWLAVALASFGITAWIVARLSADSSRAARVALTAFGASLLVLAAAPSDRWFPWEGPSTAFGLVHASLAVLAPPLLLIPMARASTRGWLGAYALAVALSGASLLLGFIHAGPPPLIGLAERLLALCAVAWFAVQFRHLSVKR